MTDRPEPTELERQNAATRAAIAEKAAAEWAEVKRLALSHLGPNWWPWMKIVVVDSDFRNGASAEPVATVYKVHRGQARLTENSVFLRRMPDGTVRHAPAYEELLPMLHEKHPTKTLVIKGQTVPAPRWVVHWSALERYEPKSAEALAALRVSRARGKAEREEKRWAEENPLLAWRERGPDGEERGR